jgi:hypothetical protein
MVVVMEVVVQVPVFALGAALTLALHVVATDGDVSVVAAGVVVGGVTTPTLRAVLLQSLGQLA